MIRTPDGERVARLVEAKDAPPDELAVSEVNAGLYAFDAAWLRAAIGRLTPSPATGEYYVTQLVDLAVADGRAVVAHEAPDDGALDGINDRAQLAEATAMLRERINLAWLRAGVTMHDPATAYVDADVELARDVTLEPNVILRGRTRVGEGSRIGAGSQLVDSAVGPRCRVWASVLERATVEEGTTIGPFSHLRAGSSIGPDVQLGNFAEVKNSRLERGVKQHHMSYLGDAHVGAGTNVGAGTITANYDGVRKHHTEIGERVFLGVDTMLRAPVTIGDGAKTGAGAVVTRDVPAGHAGRGRAGADPRDPAARRGAGACRTRARARTRRERPADRVAGDTGPLMDLLVQIGVIVILTLLEGFFVAAEIALVSIRHSRVDQLVDEGNRAGAAGPGPARQSRSLPGRLAARPDAPRVLRVRVRRRQPGGRPCRAPRCGSTRCGTAPTPSRSSSSRSSSPSSRSSSPSWSRRRSRSPTRSASRCPSRSRSRSSPTCWAPSSAS